MYGIDSALFQCLFIRLFSEAGQLGSGSREEGNLQVQENLHVNDNLHRKENLSMKGSSQNLDSLQSVRIGGENLSRREIYRNGKGDKDRLQVGLSYRTAAKHHLRQSERNSLHEIGRPSKSSRRKPGKQKGRKGKYRAAQKHPHSDGNGETEEQSDDSVGQVLALEQMTAVHPLTPDGKSNSANSHKLRQAVTKACSLVNKCTNGGLCRFDAQLSTERCLCPLGFSGHFCETGQAQLHIN